MQHGQRTQAQVIEYIDVMVSNIPEVPCMDDIYANCEERCGVSKSTARRWWQSFETTGELPYESKKFERKMRKECPWLSANANMNDEDLESLKMIVDENPEAYLDEITMHFGRETGKFFHQSTIWKYMKRNLNYTQQSLTRRALQKDEENRWKFQHALALLLQGDPERLIIVDETHTYRSAARRRRGFGRRYSGDANLKEWYKKCVRYTMIAAADINGFIECACQTVDRNELSEEGAAGTVDREYFNRYVKEKLCPTLGRYVYGEPRSVVLLDILDNATIPYTVIDAIQATGAQIIFVAPHSPDLNPIENYFSMYKAFLKRENFDAYVDSNWRDIHFEALGCVNRDIGISYFRKCGIPGAREIFTAGD
jgi:transposase